MTEVRKAQDFLPINNTVSIKDQAMDQLDNFSSTDGAKTSTNSNFEASDVVNFYKKKNVLVTGGSGFLGKVLIWKLIEACPDIGTIYVLLRSKNNLSAEKRLIQLLKGKPFSPKYNYVDLLNKMVAIESDMTVPGLGLSQSDKTLLQERVNVVIHSAASVKFDAPLKDNLRDNVYGTRSIVELCETLQNLNSFVHVSTAYCNCQSRDIGEDIQPLERDVDDVVRIVESLPDDACEMVTDKLIERRPNTYTYTKAVAEHFVARREGKFPICIVRPSIVISANDEPTFGWVDNVNGIAGLGALASIGMLRTIDWNYYGTSDMVPVDYVANCIIVAGYDISVSSPKKIKVYNMTSGNMNPISWGVFFDMLRATAVKTPPVKIVRPMIHPPRKLRANPITFFFIKLLSELLFAYTVDTILASIGYKRIMVKITQKMHHGYKILMPFTTNEWNFSSENVTNLYDSLRPVDKNTFKFDMREFDWLRQADATWAGARANLLKEEPTEESYAIGRSRQKLVTAVHYGFLLILTASLIFASYYGVRLVGLV